MITAYSYLDGFIIYDGISLPGFGGLHSGVSSVAPTTTYISEYTAIELTEPAYTVIELTEPAYTINLIGE